jgi:predicted cupin superfamily sugar epimerase
MSTAIHFLLTKVDRSLFHRIKSDEVWHFHYGDPLAISVLSPRGLTTYKLGADPSNGEVLQVVVPANHWFGGTTLGDYTLVSCTVAPGFDFQDFELGDREQLLKEFPGQSDIIIKLTTPNSI